MTHYVHAVHLRIDSDRITVGVTREGTVTMTPDPGVLTLEEAEALAGALAECAQGARGRAAMEAREPLARTDVAGQVTDVHGRSGHIGVDHDAVVLIGLPLPLDEARKAHRMLGDAIADREQWISENGDRS